MSGNVYENPAGLVYEDANGRVYDDDCPPPSCCVPCTQVYTAHVCGFSPDCNQVFVCKGVYDGTAGTPAVIKGTLRTWNGSNFTSPEFFACITGIGEPVIDLVDLQPGAFVMQVIDGAADCEDEECTGPDPTGLYVLARPCGGTGPQTIAVLASEITGRVFFSLSSYCYCIDCTANEYIALEDLPVATTIMTYSSLEALAFDGDCCSCICGTGTIDWPNMTVCEVEELIDGMTFEESEAERLSRQLKCCCPDPFFAGGTRLNVRTDKVTTEYWSYSGSEGETLVQYVKVIQTRTVTQTEVLPACVEGETITGTSHTTDVNSGTDFTRYVDDFGVWHEITGGESYTVTTDSEPSCGPPCIPTSLVEPPPGSTVPCVDLAEDTLETERVVSRTTTCDADTISWRNEIRGYGTFGSSRRLTTKTVAEGTDSSFITVQRGKGRCPQATSCVTPPPAPGGLMAEGGPEEFHL